MANQKITYDAFKRGDTPVFQFNYTPPSSSFSWTGITADLAITDVEDPANNTGAAAYTADVALTINADNSATVSIQPTVAESKALTPGTTYQVEAQLKDVGGTNVTTPVTGTVKILQDYVI